MSYSNAFLQNFRPVFFGILKERGIRPERVELEVIDEESERGSMFEPVDVRDVLEQLGEDLNFLSIYTERPAYFYEFAERMYEENGLVVMLFSKRELFPMVRQHFDIVSQKGLCLRSLMDRISDSGSDGCGSIPHGGTSFFIPHFFRLCPVSYGHLKKFYFFLCNCKYLLYFCSRIYGGAQAAGTNNNRELCW